MSIIKVEKELEITCTVEVEVEPAEKGYGECPDYPATSVIYAIYADGKDITDAFSEEYLSDLANEIAEEAEEEGNEARMERTLSMRMAA